MKEEIETLTNLAYIYMNYGKTKRAIDYLLIAYRIDPSNIQVKKMKIAAFREIGAFSQALDIIAELESKNTLEHKDKITLLLMKSICLKGLDKFSDGKIVFADYLKQRKEYARQEFIKKYQSKAIPITQINDSSLIRYQSGDFDVNKEIQHFLKKETLSHNKNLQS